MNFTWAQALVCPGKSRPGVATPLSFSVFVTSTWYINKPLFRLIDWLIDRSIDRLFQLDHACLPLNVPVKLVCFCSASHLRVSHFAILQPVARQDLRLLHTLQGNLHGGNHDGGVEPVAPEGQDEREVQWSLCCRLPTQKQ